MTGTGDTSAPAHRTKLRKWLTLAGLAVIGLCTVSIPVILALVVSS